MQAVAGLIQGPVVERDGDGGVPLGVAPVPLVHRRGDSQAGFNPRHCVRRHSAGGYFLQSRGGAEDDVQLPRSTRWLHPC